jgi:PTS system fructose-specific IIC component
MKLIDYLKPEQILLDLKSRTKLEVLKEVSEYAFQNKLVPDREALFRGLAEREDLISTGIGSGIAIPHTRYEGPEWIFILLARSSEGVEFDALDGEPVYLFIVIAGPETADKEQLKILSRTARLLKQPDFRDRLLTMPTAEEVLRCIQEEEALF